jgi:hypothetical protein
MKNRSNKFLVLFTLISALTFTNCENSNELPTELSIQQKVALLEGSEWLLKGYEDRVMHTFKYGKQFTMVQITFFPKLQFLGLTIIQLLEIY